MDIYARRRLTAVGVFVTFISVIAIAAGSGGGDDDAGTLTTETGASGASGAQGAQALTKADFIAQADAICADANSAIADDSGVGTAVPDPGVKIRRSEYNQLKALTPPEQGAGAVNKLVGGYKQLLAAVEKRELANKRGDVDAQTEAADDIANATDTIATAGAAAGFRTCDSLDETAGASSNTATGTDTGAATDTGTDTGAATTPPTGITPPADTAPPADTGAVTPTAPPATDPGTTPPADSGTDSSGGVTP